VVQDEIDLVMRVVDGDADLPADIGKSLAEFE
jgi:hypothetical protein